MANKFATLDTAEENPVKQTTALQKTRNPAELMSTNPNDIVQTLLANPSLVNALARQDNAPAINWEIASEVTSVLNEIEGNYFDESKRGHRFINWETQDIPYYVLRSAAQTEPARLIINKRRLDLDQFGQTPKEEGIQRGFKLKFRNPDYSPTKEEKALLKIWEKKLVDTFFFAPNDDMPSLSKFLGSSYEDWFTYDDMTYEIRRDGFGKPIAIHAQDPTIWKPVVKKRRYASLDDEEIDALSKMLEEHTIFRFGENIFEEDNDNTPDYIGEYGGYEFAHLTRENLIKSHFFVQSSFRRAKRGYSVVEQGLNFVAWLVDTLKMNSTNFTKNRIPDGFVTLPGVGQFQLQKIQKILSAYLNGTGNNNRIPMIDLATGDGKTGDAKFVNIRGNSREMEFHLWFTLLFSAWCQLSGTDPNEISFSSHKDAVGKQSMFKESADGIIKESKDVGARTFLSHTADTLNTPFPKSKKNMFQEITGLDVECEFVGFELEDKKQKYEIYSTEMKSSATRNEILAREDKEKYELMIKMDGKEVNYFDIPGTMDTNLHQIITSKVQQQMQADQAQMQAQMGEGAPGEEGELTEADRQLLEEYGDRDDVSIDDDLRSELEADEEEEQPEENEEDVEQ